MKAAAARLVQNNELTIREQILETLPWRFSCFGQQVEIESFCAKTQAWLTIATVNAVNGVDAEDLAGLISETMNALQPKED
jgi:hypothetical protein